MGVPTKFYTFVDGQSAAGLLTAARLNGNFDPLYECLNPAAGGLEDTNIKAGAKILCSDRSYTGTAKITGTFEFQTCPVVPDGSILPTKLGSGINADTVDGSHAADFAGITHAARHQAAGADAIRLDDLAAPEDNADLNVSTAAHGLVPKAPNDTAQFLRGDGAWAKPIGYALDLRSAIWATPSGGTTVYWGGVTALPGIVATYSRLYVPRAGTIKAAYVFWMTTGTTGTNEDISVYVRHNNTTDYLVETIGSTDAAKVFDNTSLDIAVAQGDYIEIKMVLPSWSTSPTQVNLGGSIYIE